MEIAMNDEEDIMKKLQKVANRDCSFCWQKGENCDGDECEKVIAEKILNIYNRQQAEIKRLESLLNQLFKDVDYKLQYIYELEKKLESDQAEAIKECVNKYTEMLIDEYHLRTDLQIASIKRLEQKVLEEMVGEENA